MYLVSNTCIHLFYLQLLLIYFAFESTCIYQYNCSSIFGDSSLITVQSANRLKNMASKYWNHCFLSDEPLQCSVPKYLHQSCINPISRFTRFCLPTYNVPKATKSNFSCPSFTRLALQSSNFIDAFSQLLLHVCTYVVPMKFLKISKLQKFSPF